MSNNIYTCSTCQEAFSSKSALGGHSKLHTGFVEPRCCSILTHQEISASRLDQHEAAWLKRQTPNKICGNCQTPFRSVDKEAKYCRHKCSATATNPTRILTTSWKSKKPPKLCLHCSSILKNRKSTFCSNRCYADYHRNIWIQKWLAGEIIPAPNTGCIPHKIRSYLLDLHQNKCSKCRWREVHPITGRVPLQIEHKNGNWNDNRFENLEVLCPNCHSLTPTFGILNRGNGRRIAEKKRKIGDPGGN